MITQVFYTQELYFQMSSLFLSFHLPVCFIIENFNHLLHSCHNYFFFMKRCTFYKLNMAVDIDQMHVAVETYLLNRLSPMRYMRFRCLSVNRCGGPCDIQSPIELAEGNDL